MASICAVISHVREEEIGPNSLGGLGNVDLSFRKKGTYKDRFLEHETSKSAERLWVDAIAMPEILEHTSRDPFNASCLIMESRLFTKYYITEVDSVTTPDSNNIGSKR